MKSDWKRCGGGQRVREWKNAGEFGWGLFEIVLSNISAFREGRAADLRMETLKMTNASLSTKALVFFAFISGIKRTPAAR